MAEKKKRKVTFSETPEDVKRQKQPVLDSRLHSGKHTLDSDEDDEDEQGDDRELGQDELDDIGQEKATIGFDNDVKITPFNIDEELEDGHYDESGCFQWKRKDKDEVHDAWLDEIDWTNVKNYKLKNSQATADGTNDSENDDLSDNENKSETQFNEINTLQSMLGIMQPGESVVRTIKRLGTLISNKKTKPQGKQKKLLPGEVPMETSDQLSSDQIEKNKILLDNMSGYADQFVSNGELDIYQETYERLKSKLERLQTSTGPKRTTTDSSFDMYGESDISASVNKPKSTEKHESSTILWEYVTDENTKDEIHGPFTTEHMIRLTNTEGKINKDKARCRRVGTEQFYAIKRVDFDLYID